MIISKIAIGAATALLGFGAGVVSQSPTKPAPRATWSLVHITKGHVYVDDHNLTKSDCLRARHRHQRCFGAAKLAKVVR